MMFGYLFKVMLISLIGAFSYSCKPVDAVKMGGYIIGPTNDIRPLNQKARSELSDELFNSSVLLSTTLNGGGTKFCSGVIIADPADDNGVIVLTNHHCFSEVSENSKVSHSWLPEACVRTEAYFGFRIDSQSDVFKATCKEGSLKSDVLGDIAFFKINEELPDHIAPLQLITDFDLLSGKRQALVIHYPDIASNFMRMDETNKRLPAASVTKENCDTAGFFSPSDWHLNDALPWAVRHTCDIVKGSSGSALIDVATNQIIGINWGGIELTYADRVEVYNVATRADYVHAFLAEDLENFRAQQELTLRSDASQHTRDSSQDMTRAEKSFGSRVKKASCGVTGHNHTATGMLLIAIMLALPAVLSATSARLQL